MLNKLNAFKFFNLIRHKSLQNFIFLSVIQSSNVIISLVSMPLLIQALGVDQFGMVNLALSVIFLANVWVAFGYNLSGPREIAINQGNKLILSAIASKIFVSKGLLSLIAFFVISLLMFNDEVFKGYKSILFFSLVLLFSEATASTWLFQGLEKMKLVTLANLFSKLLYLLALILFINHPEDAQWANFYLGISALGINVLLLFFIHYELGIHLMLPRMQELILSWKENFSLFLSGMAGHISVYGGLIILSFFAIASVMGMYSLAERISMVLRMFPILITQSVYPNASKLYQEDSHLFYGFVKKVYWSALGISLLITLFVLAFAPQIIWLVSGNDFASSILFLRILSFVPFLASLNIANMVLILVADYKTLLFNATWTFGVFMIVSASLLSHLYGGEGLAYGLLATEIFIVLVCSYLLKIKNNIQFVRYYQRIFSRNYSA